LQTETLINLKQDPVPSSKQWRALRRLSAKGSARDRMAAIIPHLDSDGWEFRPASVVSCNCYQFAVAAQLGALHHPQEDAIHSLSPGEIAFRRANRNRPDFLNLLARFQDEVSDSAEGRFTDFAADMVSGAIHDGLLFEGNVTYRPKRECFPAALFLGKRGEGSERLSHDHHWYSLRQVGTAERAWCAKFVNDDPEVIGTLRDVFRDAGKRGYWHFAGYFNRPAALDLA
jgi:hypothetical protein